MSMVQPYADVIVLKTRVDPITGKNQYCHWNETRNCWVEPNWIDY